MSGTQTMVMVNTTTGNAYDPGNHLLPNVSVCPSTTALALSVGGCNNGNNVSGQWADGYWAVEHFSTLYPGNANIGLRIDDASSALQQLVPYAYATSQSNNATYQMQAFFFNNIMNDPQNLYPALPAGISYITGTPVAKMTSMTALTSSTSLTIPTIPVPRWNDFLCVTSGTCPNQVPYSMTDFHNMFTEMNTLMPNPGTGTKSSTPQEVLFLITDGFDDDFGSGNRGALTSTELAQCATIKARGIKIAIIYTQYLASSITLYPQYAAALTPTDQDAQALQTCASTNASGVPLFYEVTQGQSITPALQQLFASVVQSAYLAQ
jgi:hypothetical protein